MQTYNLANLKIGAWDVTWKAFEFGAVDEVSPDLELVTKGKQVGSLGPVDVGHWIMGLKGKVVTSHREITPEQCQQLLPWYAGSGDSIPMVPEAWHADLYAYAGLLNLHPQEMGDDDTLDLNFLKAVPMKVTPPARDGGKSDVIKDEWTIYPDRARIAAGLLAYAYVGPVPASPPPP